MTIQTLDRKPEIAADLRLALPKGRLEAGIGRLLAEAGIQVTPSARNYRPSINLAGTETKILKPQAVVEMLAIGRRDAGFAGADWVAELGADLVEVLDTELDPVRLVVAAPADLLEEGALPDRPLVIASEYARLARRWMRDRGIDGDFVHSYGATEVFPPEDADLILDNTSTGATLAANDLEIVDEVLRSSTRFYATRSAMADPARRERVEAVALLLDSVLQARRRAMVEVNCPKDGLVEILDELPAMRQPTVSQLAGGQGFALKAAVLRSELPALIPRLKAVGATDVVVSRLEQIVP